MRRKLTKNSIVARLLNELFTGPSMGLSASELAARLDAGVQTVRTAANRLVHTDILDFRRIQNCNNEDRVKFFLSEEGRAFIAGVELMDDVKPAPPPEPRPGDDEDDMRPLSAPPDVADVIRFVPNSVWALATMTPRVAG